MNTKTSFIRLVAIAFVGISGMVACKKLQLTGTGKTEQPLQTIVSRMADPAHQARVTLTQAQVDKVKSGIPLRLLFTGNKSFITPEALAEETNIGTGLSQGGGATVIGWNPGNCAPISAAILQQYQAEANACCCSFWICLLGENCDFYVYAFSPNNGCD
jgi:hypothetical protein